LKGLKPLAGWFSVVFRGLGAVFGVIKGLME
jgi:hypothetical protein